MAAIKSPPSFVKISAIGVSSALFGCSNLDYPLSIPVPPKPKKLWSGSYTKSCVCIHNDFSRFSSASPSAAATPNDSRQNPVNIFHTQNPVRHEFTRIGSIRFRHHSAETIQFSAKFPRSEKNPEK